MSHQPSICVFCGSRHGSRPAYAEAARATGTMLATRGWRLVYGAGDVGLMGEVARAAQLAGGTTFGVIPIHLFQREVGKRDLSTFIVTENMHERKKVMFMNSDAIVVLPGGAGSLDELFEVLTWRQIGLHEKPIFILNTEGYWNPIKTAIEHMVGEGFADRSLAEMLIWAEDVSALESALSTALS
ncbi:TIGR00730 family Rossman fold protein [Sinirhodobacter sp. WL0062]|uniref:Cytokinin riboside 5'-monophosphate phosphoribohydrolase n=1 Tax=Rhodobacter flavimaris TaxID=2907145 RepID=A0ABS8YU09_9RHOB|nr:TIGR00730 family Rossman fold protein [Sinirhodobacter sp. WL0062]MCE5971936.1 TIGR00730 family Rossman fold protein [Sinirhodobacter sp. WL0062]